MGAVNAHLIPGRSNWMDAAARLKDLYYVGIHNIREARRSAGISQQCRLAQAGIKFDLFASLHTNSFPRLAARLEVSAAVCKRHALAKRLYKDGVNFDRGGANAL